MAAESSGSIDPDLSTDADAPVTQSPHLPVDLREALRAEYRRVFHLPFDSLVTVAVNAALMSSFWFFLPPKLRDAMFTLHGTLAFAFVLSSWMYSDVPATNVLGPDALRVLAAIDRPDALRLMLVAKNIVLWTLVAPICLVIAVVDAATAHDPTVGLYSAVGIAVIPYGVLAVSCWLGILFPYHPIPVRMRLRAWRSWKTMLLRWGILVLTPYGLVPALTAVLVIPSALIWGFTSSSGLSAKVPDQYIGLGIGVACALAVAAAILGHRLALRLMVRRRDKLVAFLSDPLRG